jgi:transposase
VITIGVDAHKRVHVAHAVDDAGHEIASWKGANSRGGWCDFASWAAALGAERQIGIEGAWSYGRGLAQSLVCEGEAVYEVNPRWTALGRRRAKKRDKTDRLDARAVALFVRQEAVNLTAVAADDETAVLDLLAIERGNAVAEATRLRNQLHALLMQLDPEYEATMPALKSAAGLAILKHYAAPDGRPLSEARVAAVHRLAERLALALAQSEEIASKIRALAEMHFAPLTTLCGVNLLTAGTLAGILGPGRRFVSDAALASYAGVSPLEASSAGHTRHRLNRGGDRRLNAVVYMIALTQARSSPAARAYLERRASEGKTKREAMRALKRYIVRAIWRLWNACIPEPPPATGALTCT